MNKTKKENILIDTVVEIDQETFTFFDKKVRSDPKVTDAEMKLWKSVHLLPDSYQKELQILLENMSKTWALCWALCKTCGDELYPKADKSRMNGITLHEGDCLRCGKKKVWLTPISDYEFAMGDDSKWD